MDFSCVRRPADRSRPRAAKREQPQAAPRAGGDELQDLAVTFRQTVERLSNLVRELDESRESAVRAEQRFRELVQTLDAIVWEAEFEDRKFTFVSRRAEDLLGYPVEQWLGEPRFWESRLHPEDRERTLGLLRGVCSDGGKLEYDYRMRARDGRTLWLHDILHVICDEQGRPTKVRGVTLDVTDRRRAQEALEKSERSLAKAQEIAQLGSWEYDVAADRFICSPEIYRIFGFKPGERVEKLATFYEFVHPEDRPGVQEALTATLREGVPYNKEYRIIRPDGQVRSLHGIGEAVGNGDGAPDRLIGTVQDVTEQKRIERELAEANAQALEAEVEKKRFYRDVIRAVTQGKFELADQESLPEVGELIADLPVTNGPEYAAARKAVMKAAAEGGMSEEAAIDFVLAVGEAVTNALKHAAGGRCRIYRTEESLIVRISDCGSGITAGDLPAAILMPGFSTKVSLGMGYTMMLKLADRVWLATSPEGTTVQLEKRFQPAAEEEDLLSEVLKRF